ncbi:MAG: leucyl aminopeptidase [Bacteroidales bacterium]|nr:leucyl aminopeptidase [Bacteroidales bacterium]
MICLQKKEGKDRAKLWVLSENKSNLTKIFSKTKAQWIENHLTDNEKDIFVFNTINAPLEIFIRPNRKDSILEKQLENCRILASKALPYFENENCKEVEIIGDLGKKHFLATAEGLSLSAYRFTKYFTDSDEKKAKLQKIFILSEDLSEEEIETQNIVVDAVKKVRDWVNEPASYLTATSFAREMAEFARQAGASVEIMNRKKIEALKMGGLLAVNQGSEDPPTFTVIEWNPKNAVNKKPVVLVGKGVTFDTGGSNLKPERYMDEMKTDMAGAATVTAAICAVAKSNLPVYVVALMPATDNRISNHSFLPSDVITMHNGKTVEVANTDAEGRLILADAISYAARFNPILIIDLATLTGAAARAIGKYGIVGMGNAQKELNELIKCSFEVYERIAEFPFWDDYAKELKSDIADMKNLGGAEGGAISAGKFLEKFTNAPYIHLDIAGCAYLSKPNDWKTAGGTGTGVRLLYRFLEKIGKMGM